MDHIFFDRRSFLRGTAIGAVNFCGIQCHATETAAKPRSLMQPRYDTVVCPWSAEHPRHDHQLIFKLDPQRLLLVWSEYYTVQPNPDAERGNSGATDEVACQITSMVSNDHGRTWGQRQVIQPNRWQHNVKHPNLIRLSDAEVLLSYVGWDSDTQRNVYMRRSVDNAQTWGDEFQISEPGWYCNNADRALRLKSGRVLIPAHGPRGGQYVGGVRYTGGDLHSFVFYSDDGFRTWKRSENSMTAAGRGCHEPTIVELHDGRLMCLLRNSNQRQYVSYSEDGGVRWSKPQPTQLASPESPALVKRIPTTGDLLVLWNNVASKSNWPRTPLTAAISTDEGKTWRNFQDIDNRQHYDAAYPSVTFVGDEALVAYYTRPTDWARDTEITLRIFGIDQFYA